ncbi:hemicentin-2-like [Pollicipes pollicipes]|uniref:hemicentin-2-like n=1 Tax=Pollicipes pollicipes TaxID=41117 RepID=UPI001884DF92|nr:hemicentin-2-like [Pollicipes pollicipes]
MYWITGLLLAGAMLTSGQRPGDGNVDVMEGQDAVLQCRFDPALADGDDVSFYWSHKNIREWDTVAIQKDLFRERYSVDANPVEGRYDLTITSATYENDNGQFVCKVRRVGSGTDLHTEKVSLTVLMPPNPPTIGSEASEPLEEGRPAPLSCSSDGGSPPPEIRWYRRGSSTPLPAELTLAEDRSQPTVSRLTLEPTREDNGEQLECVVWNRAMAEGERLRAVTDLNVNYYPRIEVGPDNPLRVEMGRSVQLQCRVDAKPAVTNVRWIRNNAFVGTDYTLALEDIGVDDAGAYTCSAENAVAEEKQDLTLDVLYAPNVRVRPEREVPEGGSVQVLCEVDANPQAQHVYWLREGEPEFRQDGATLRLSRVSAVDNGEYVCVAVNHVLSVGMTEPEERVGNATTRILIRHAPGQAVISPEEPVGVEGRSLTLNCAARPPGHPTPKYRWWRADRPDTPLGFGANLTLDGVQARHAGQYLCEPENELGRGAAAAVEVRVFRAPEFNTRLQPEVKRPVETVQFAANCSAQGRPKPSVAWLKDGVDISTADGLYDVSIDETEMNDGAFTVSSALNFRGQARQGDRLTPADRGNYTCRFENVAGEAETTMLLRIRHAPIVKNEYNMAAFDVGEEATIACQMQAYPAPVFHWSHQGAPLAADSSGFYDTNTTELGNDVHQSVLRLASVRLGDYGEYVCQAQNEEGEHSTSLRLQAKSRPDPPTELRAAELGTSWALLDWRPGFDGGYRGTIHHVTLVDERGKERAFDCQTRRPCNVTSLQHRSTYRFRIRANNEKGNSDDSQQMQFTTQLDLSQLPQPQRAQFERGSRQLSFHVVSSAIDVVGMLDVRSDEGDWRPVEQPVPVSNNRGLAELPAALGPVADVRTRLCLRGNTSVCGPPVQAENVAAGSVLPASLGVPVTTIIIIVVVVIVLVAALVLAFICCRRGKMAKKTNKAFNDDAYNRQKLPAYYPPGGGPDNKPGVDATNLARLNQDPTKVIYGARPGYEHSAAAPEHVPASTQPPPNGAINMAYMENSYSNSNNGGSVNSQDSLWQVKAGNPDNRSHGNPDNRSYSNPDNRSYGNPDTRSYGNPDNRSYGNPDNRSYGNPDTRSYGNPDNRSYGNPEGRPFTYDPNNYDPAQANYLPDQPLGYGDYGQFPAQQAYPTDAAYPAQDEYGRPYESDPYGAVGGRGRPHHADGGYRDVSGLPDPYADQEPDNKPQVSFDESLESGYSTPNSRSRRVIREIIV